MHLEIFNHLWQSTLFAVAAGLLALALRKNRAHVRYWLWLTTSVKFLVPFALLMSLGSWVQPAKKIAPPENVAIAMIEIAQPFVPASAPARDWKPAVMLALWACGFAAIAAIRLRGWLSIRAAVRSSIPVEVLAPVEVRSSPGLLEPGVVGLLRPVLLLPQGIEERLTPPQLEAVLAHELCHVRRRDNLFASIHMIVEAAFWFHPLVWWIGARLLEERERACDEEVLTLGNEPRVYAEGILNVCKLYVESPLACVSGVTGSNIKKRIEAIMTNRIVLRLNAGKKAALAVAAVAALAAPIVVGMMNAPSARAQAQQPAVGTAPNLQIVINQTPDKPPVRLLAQAAPPGGRGRGETPPAPPAGVGDDEYNHRLAYVQATFGSTNNPKARTYLHYGPPDSMETNGSNDEIWRYKFLEDFRSNVELQFDGHTQAMHINYPQPVVFEGVPADAAVSTLAAELTRQLQSHGEPVATNVIAGLPIRHASMQIYPPKGYRVLTVPLDGNSFSGVIDVLGIIKMSSSSPGPATLATVRDHIVVTEQAAGRTLMYTMSFTLDPGSYVCGLVVREQASGRMYGETIDFEAK